MPAGESCKTPDVLQRLYGQMLEHGLDRHCYVLALGGGALLDAVGYACATFHRGVRLIRIPTTVLAQNDAGVGVKNGINAFEQKNLLGAFQPANAVINDFQLLLGLPRRDQLAGLAEAVKVAAIRTRPSSPGWKNTPTPSPPSPMSPAAMPSAVAPSCT